MSITIQLEPGNQFKCGCRTHCLTDYAVSRMSYAQFVCTNCGETMEPLGEVYQYTPGEFPSDTLLACTLSDDGQYTLGGVRVAPYYSYCSVYNPGVSFNEAGRRAIVRALYRPGDIDELSKEPVFRRLFELLNGERIQLLDKLRGGPLSQEDSARLVKLTSYVDDYVARTYPRSGG